MLLFPDILGENRRKQGENRKSKKGKLVNLVFFAHLAQDHKNLVVAVKNELCKFSNLKRKPKLVLCVRTISLKSEVIVFENN